VIREPGPKVPAPLHVKVEHGKEERDLPKLKSDLEGKIHDVLRFKAEVELVPGGPLSARPPRRSSLRNILNKRGEICFSATRKTGQARRLLKEP